MKDLLILHTAADQAWAEWIAWQLEKAGYTTLLKTWDFQRSDFVRDLSQATSECDRTLVVLSETYQDAAFAYPEWAVAFSRDPLGEKGLLIPVKVESCETTELLGPLSYIDLTGLEEKAAALALLDGVKGTRRGMNAPAFPGQGLRPSLSRRLRVFLCHASQDKAAVRELYQRLRSDGMSPWLDEENLLPGQKWEFEIERAVRGADAIVACLSPQSISKRGYVQKELRLALDIAREQPEDAIFLIPLRLKECEMPQQLLGWQWVDLFMERGYAKLIAALRARARDLA